MNDSSAPQLNPLQKLIFSSRWLQLPLYLGLWRGRETTWRRTARDGEPPRG